MIKVGHGTVDDITIMTNGNITEYPQVTETFSTQATDCTMEIQESKAIISANLQMENGNQENLELSFEVESSKTVGFSAKLLSAAQSGQNWMSLNYKADQDEEVYGMGL